MNKIKKLFLITLCLCGFFGVYTFANAQNIVIYSSLWVGSRGTQVRELQQTLTNLGFYNGPITGYFGNLTKTAVIKFQKTNNIAPAAGYFGPISKAKLNQLLTIQPTTSLPQSQILISTSTPKIIDVCANNINTKKLDVVFVPINFENQSEFESMILEHIDFNAKHKGLLYYEPFKSNNQKFKFWQTNKMSITTEQNFIQKGCYYSDNACMIDDVKKWLSDIGCSYDKAIIIFNNLNQKGGGWAESLNGKIAATIAKEYGVFASQGHSVTVHEFSHLLGLRDEAVRASVYTTYPAYFGSNTNYDLNVIKNELKDAPNCDVAGCPKWCNDYIKVPSGPHYELCKNLSENSCRENVNCVWISSQDPYYKTQCIPLDDHINIGLSCLNGTGCYHSCNGVGAWRPADYIEPEHRPTSIMFYTMNALGFDAVDQRYLKSVLNNYE